MCCAVQKTMTVVAVWHKGATPGWRLYIQIHQIPNFLEGWVSHYNKVPNLLLGAAQVGCSVGISSSTLCIHV